MDDANRFDDDSVWANAADRPAASRAACGIAVMAKASAPGRTKTRLVPPLTFEEAAALNTAFLKDVADNILCAAKAATEHGGIAGYAAFGPPGSTDFFHRTLPARIDLIDAWLPNFGDCLLHTIHALFRLGHSSAVVLNSDSPTLPTALLLETAAALARPGDRAVLGPATDGGYYLLGLKAAHRRVFEDIAWSTDRVAAQTLQRAREIGLEVHCLPLWYDVDDGESFARLQAELDAGASAQRGPESRAPRYPRQTAELLGALTREADLARRIGGLSRREPVQEPVQEPTQV